MNVVDWRVSGKNDILRVCRSFDGVVLDLGCGDGGSSKLRFPHLFVVGVEIRPDLATQASKILELVLCCSICDVPRLIPQGMFDYVTMFDSLEHLEKQDGKNVLAWAKAQARKMVLVFSPKGTLTEAFVPGLGFESHRSVWEPEELESLGFDVQVLPNFHGPENDVMFALAVRGTR